MNFYITAGLILFVFLSTRKVSKEIRARAFDIVSMEEAWRIVDGFRDSRRLFFLTILPVFVVLSLVVLFSSWSNVAQAAASAIICLVIYIPMLIFVANRLNQLQVSSEFFNLFLVSRAVALLGNLLALVVLGLAK